MADPDGSTPLYVTLKTLLLCLVALPYGGTDMALACMHTIPSIGMRIDHAP